MRRKMKLYSTRGVQEPSHLQKESCMSFQICIKTDKSLQQLATEICNLFSLPPFRQISFSDEPYCQFVILGMLILLHRADEEDADPDVNDYNYCIHLQLSVVGH